jgi:hypothetical protein
VLSLSLNQILVLYTWFPLAALLFFLMLIGRFYERFSGQRTRFRWFVLPILLFGAAAVRYASSGRLTSDLLGDVLAAAGGVILIYLSISLYHLMTTNR